MIGCYVKRKDGRLLHIGTEASFDHVVCVSLLPFILVSPAGFYIWRDFDSADFEIVGKVPDGVWWPCVYKVYGPMAVLYPPRRVTVGNWHGPVVDTPHDFPACAIFRGGRCTCD